MTLRHKKTCRNKLTLLSGTLGRGQNLEQLNVEQPIFRISEISNMKGTKDELFDFIIFDLKKNYICLNYWNTQNI